MPEISIIIPIYNADKYLSRCLDSLLSQDFNNFEVIMVNDGSTDLSKTLCDNYKLKDNRIKVVHKENEGVSSARNIGIKQSKGRYIVFIDPDDYIEDFMLSKMYEKAENLKCDLVICDFNTNSRNRCNILCTPNEVLEHEALKKDYIQKILTGDQETYCWNKLYKADLIKENEIYFPDYNIWEDAIFNYMILKYTKRVYYTPHKLYNYMTNSNGLSVKKHKDKYEASIEMIKLKKDLLNIYNIEDSAILEGMYKCFIWDTISSFLDLFPMEKKCDRFNRYKKVLNDGDLGEAFQKNNNKFINSPLKFSLIEQAMRNREYNKLDFLLFTLCSLDNIKQKIKVAIMFIKDIIANKNQRERGVK